jgi:tetratricopeptide (TPR) repeat protein
MARAADRHRFRRKDLREPDELATLTGQAAAWLGAHRTMAVSAGVALLVVAAIALVMARMRLVRDEAATRDFQAAYETFQTGEFADAAVAFDALADQYPRAPYGRLARLYRAHAFARQGENTRAIAAYQDYLGLASKDGFLRQEALASLGYAKEAVGDLEGALDAYREAGDLEGPYRTDALLATARLHEAAGRTDEAHEIYVRLDKEAADAGLKALLQPKLARAGRPPTATTEPAAPAEP